MSSGESVGSTVHLKLGSDARDDSKQCVMVSPAVGCRVDVRQQLVTSGIAVRAAQLVCSDPDGGSDASVHGRVMRGCAARGAIGCGPEIDPETVHRSHIFTAANLR